MIQRLIRHSALAFFFLVAAEGNAQDRARAVIIGSAPASDEAVVRIRAELSASGFDVMSMDASIPNDRGPLVVAKVSRLPSGPAVDVWVYHRRLNKAFVRRVSGDNASDTASVIAVRTAEAIRASLIDLSNPDAAGMREATAPEDVAAWLTPRNPPASPVAKAPQVEHAPTPTVVLGVGWYVLASVQGMGAGHGPVLAGGWVWHPQSTLRFRFAAVEWNQRVEGAVGAADVRQQHATAELTYAFARDRSWDGYGYGGIGVYHLGASGSAPGPYVAKNDNVWSAACSLGVGGSLAFADSLRLTAEAGALVLQPSARVTMAGERVASTGTPALSGSVGVQASW